MHSNVMHNWEFFCLCDDKIDWGQSHGLDPCCGQVGTDNFGDCQMQGIRVVLK